MSIHESDDALLDKSIKLLTRDFNTDSAIDEATGTIQNIFKKLVNLFKSITALNASASPDAAAAIVGMMLEHYMDMKILQSDNSGAALKRYKEFFHIQKFRAAHRILSFSDDAAGDTNIDVSEYEAFRIESGGIDKIREKVIETWGADNRGKASYPVHWSGRKCTRVIAHEFGPKTEELYIRAYSIPGWMMCGEGAMTEVSDCEAISDRLRNAAQLILVEAVIIMLEIFRIEEETAFYNESAAVLRNNPGKPLPLSFFN